MYRDNRWFNLAKMQETDIIRIAFVEDNPVNRNTFRQNVQGHAKWKIAFIATNGSECLAELKGMPLVLLPHIIFMDIEMPFCLMASKQLLLRNQSIRIFIL